MSTGTMSSRGSIVVCRPIKFLSHRALLLIFLTVRNGEGQSSHVLVFCVNFERHISTHITTSIKCYLVSLAKLQNSPPGYS